MEPKNLGMGLVSLLSPIWHHRIPCNLMEGLNMESLPEYVKEYRKQLEKGYIQKAYQGLMEYIMDLRTHFKNKYPDYFVSGSIYYGYDIFCLFPRIIKEA